MKLFTTAVTLSILMVAQNGIQLTIGKQILKEKPVSLGAFNRPIFVHLIPHTHDDVGWLKTVDEYYTGSKVKTAHANVRLIISTVIDELLHDPAKRFSYAEMKFFTMWWDEQTEQMKD